MLVIVSIIGGLRRPSDNAFGGKPSVSRRLRRQELARRTISRSARRLDAFASTSTRPTSPNARRCYDRGPFAGATLACVRSNLTLFSFTPARKASAMDRLNRAGQLKRRRHRAPGVVQANAPYTISQQKQGRARSIAKLRARARVQRRGAPHTSADGAVDSLQDCLPEAFRGGALGRSLPGTIAVAPTPAVCDAAEAKFFAHHTARRLPRARASEQH
jgi:hypothetical protein